MCGIAGIFSTTLIPDVERHLAKMLKAMHHRGPDSSSSQSVTAGGWLGHTRLAVIDPSPAGAQPMCRGPYVIVYNGEIYNFKEERSLLERQGFAFRTNTDTEVLLALYERYGINFTQRLYGVYAFALFDKNTQTLYCCRDALGVKPFLYCELNGTLLFASELKALLATGLIPKDIDYDAALGLMIRGSVPQPQTLLKHVRVLPAGHMLRRQEGHTTLTEHDRLTIPAPFQGGPDDRIEAARSLLDTILEQQSISDVPLGAFLSGGLDSSLMVALLARQRTSLKTFSIGFEPDLTTATEDETDDAAIVAAHIGVQHAVIRIEQRDICRNLPAIARDLDHPTVDGVNSWLVCRAAARELKVALSGTGGDELFAGYPWFAAMRKAQKRSWWRFWQHDNFVDTFNKQYIIFPSDTARQLVPTGVNLPRREDPFASSGILNRVTGCLLTGYTRDQLLFDMDTASMAHSLEVRVPLLDPRLATFALSLPDDSKIAPSDANATPGSYAHSGVKRLLLDLGRPLLPEGFAGRAKRGFTMPFDAWLQGELRETCQDLLSSETVKKRNIFDPVAVNRVCKTFYAGQTYWVQPWLLMMTELWAAEVLDQE